MDNQDASHKTSRRKLKQSIFWYKILTGRFNIILYLVLLGGFFLFLYQYITTIYQHLVPPLVINLIPTLIAFLLVLLLTPIVIYLARGLNVVVKPESPKEHMIPIPLFGGLVIFLGFMLTSLIYGSWADETSAIVFGASLILILGTIDDIAPLSSPIRLAGQVAAAFVIIDSGLVVSFLPSTWWGNLLAVIITLIWVLGIINATNFVDGADGLAAGFAIISCIFFFLITLHLEQYEVTRMAGILAGACGGFLIYNFKPAKIYLGDGGSTFLGFMLASLALYGGWSDKGPIIALGIPVLILGVLIFDMIYITVSRIRNGQVRSFRQWLDHRARDHFHHRLMNLGLSEKQAVLFIYLVCVILGLSALVLENARLSYPVVLLLIQATLFFIVITVLMLMGRQVE